MESKLIAPSDVKKVAVVGGGVIGIGWVLHYLRMGFDVTAYDPMPEARERIASMVNDTWPLMEDLGLRPGASGDRLVIVSSLMEAVSGADVVQEAVPEVAAMKTKVFAEMDQHAPAHAVLMTSTSGISMTVIQSESKHPERMVVGHPFNPPYLVPLVEILGGDQTSPETVAWARDFYRLNDKDPIVLEREVPAFIASRLQEAMWREALHMIAEGEATVEQIDTASQLFQTIVLVRISRFIGRIVEFSEQIEPLSSAELHPTDQPVSNDVKRIG